MAHYLIAFMHHGQICFSTERIIVIKSVASEFIDLLKQKAMKFAPGYGATESLVQKAYEKLTDAEAKGATFIFGKPEYTAHCSLHPVLLAGLTKDMLIWDEETFGPSASVHIVESDEEAIALVNDTQYGLNAALHTNNMHRAITIARQLEVAQVHVNALTEHDERKCLMSC
jgi:acyl-CoA reductase-like NAD-dependent aldehyde dehydrogenase